MERVYNKLPLMGKGIFFGSAAFKKFEYCEKAFRLI
jgi:hypothetical protein